jgi:hypothetical protein
MTSCRLRLLALVCVTSAILFPARDSRACSICQPGDRCTPGGRRAQPTGAFASTSRSRHTWKSSATLPHGHEEEEHAHPGDRERSYDRDLTFWASWTPLARATLSASVPYRWITLDEEPEHEPSSRVRNRGFGDAALYGTFVLWRDLEHSPTAWVETRAMLKAPTGSDEKSLEGERDPHAQVGTGSWDWGLGLATGRRFDSGNLYASAFYRVNQQGSLRYRYGSVILANLLWSTPVQEVAALGGALVRPGVELNFRYAGKDVSDGSLYDSSGGSIFYLTPFLELPLTRNAELRAPWLRIAARLPLGDGGLHGHQHEATCCSPGWAFRSSRSVGYGNASQVPLGPALHGSGQVAQRGPACLVLKLRKTARSPAPMISEDSSRSKIAHGRVPVVPQLSSVRFLVFAVRNCTRSPAPTMNPPTPGNFGSQRLP